MDHSDLLNLCKTAEVKPVHANTINAWVFRHGVTDTRHVPDLPNRLYDYLDEHVGQLKSECIANRIAEDGTHKMLLRMPDGKDVETVLIPGVGRLTQCISTQVGCAVGCEFCLTATAGLTRNLSAGEMVSQVMTARDISDQEIRNLVLMGMGEPLHNYEEVAKFVRIVTDPMGMAFSPHRVTLSTSGLVPGIYRMIEDDLPCNLALSLNATTDDVRSQIMPINTKYPIAKLITAIRDYIKVKNRKRVLIEYVMLEGVNDSLDDAHRLVELLDGLGCTINLLPFNPFPDSPFNRPNDTIIAAFRSILVKANMVVVVRESKGDEISAACGQLKTEIAQRKIRRPALSTQVQGDS
ncbi:MAG: 23S rRNA (adenine(2503)-C(2))-methyltransferase RlmN [Mariprofundaceae bacterium]